MSPESIQKCIQDTLNQLPEGLKTLPEDVRSKLKQHLKHTLEKMDLVTREEFDVQAAVLQRTRQKLEALEQRLKTLEGEDAK